MVEKHAIEMVRCVLFVLNDRTQKKRHKMPLMVTQLSIGTIEMTKLILVIALIVLVVILGPLLTIWALNTLFPVLAIPYALDTWAAAVILGGLFTAKVSK